MTLQQALRGPMNLTCRQVRSAKFRENGILVNGVRSRVSTMLQSGDEIRVLLEDDHDPEQIRSIRPGTVSLPPLPEEQILYEDEDILLVNKEPGLCVHPSHGHYGDTLADQVYARYAASGITEIPRIIGRLDKDTSGAVLFARNKVAAQRLFSGQAVRKEYLAVVQGNVAGSLIYTICCPIARDPSSLGRMIPDPDHRHNGKPACTHLQVLAFDPLKNISLVRLHLDTGRTHQIRVHMAYIGHPLLGDPIYGTGASALFDRAALHCSRMELVHPFSGKIITVNAPLPQDFSIIHDF